jgi:hypothetical protein
MISTCWLLVAPCFLDANAYRSMRVNVNLYILSIARDCGYSFRHVVYVLTLSAFLGLN